MKVLVEHPVNPGTSITRVWVQPEGMEDDHFLYLCQTKFYDVCKKDADAVTPFGTQWNEKIGRGVIRYNDQSEMIFDVIDADDILMDD